MPEITDWYAFGVGAFVGLAIATVLMAIVVVHEFHVEARIRREERRTYSKKKSRH